VPFPKFNNGTVYAGADLATLVSARIAGPPSYLSCGRTVPVLDRRGRFFGALAYLDLKFAARAVVWGLLIGAHACLAILSGGRGQPTAERNHFPDTTKPP
jgi:hypothetical protein